MEYPFVWEANCGISLEDPFVLEAKWSSEVFEGRTSHTLDALERSADLRSNLGLIRLRHFFVCFATFKITDKNGTTEAKNKASLILLVSFGSCSRLTLGRIRWRSFVAFVL